MNFIQGICTYSTFYSEFIIRKYKFMLEKYKMQFKIFYRRLKSYDMKTYDDFLNSFTRTVNSVYRHDLTLFNRFISTLIHLEQYVLLIKDNTILQQFKTESKKILFEKYAEIIFTSGDWCRIVCPHLDDEFYLKEFIIIPCLNIIKLAFIPYYYYMQLC